VKKGKKAIAMCMYRISSLHVVSLISFLYAVIRVGEKKEIKEMKRAVTVMVFVIRYKKRISQVKEKGVVFPIVLDSDGDSESKNQILNRLWE
jgi:hypothetical protein